MATVTKTKKFNHEETQRRVRHPLQLLRKYIRAYIIFEAVALTVLCAALLFWLGLVFDYGLMLIDFEGIGIFGVDWILELNEMDTTGIASLGCRVIILTVIVVALLALGFSKLVMRWMREFNDKALALVLERRFKKELGDRLITAVELHNPKLAEKYGYSQAMVEKTIMEAVEILKKLPVGSVFNWKRLIGLSFLVGLSTVGLLLITMVGVCLGSVVMEVNRNEEAEPKSALLSPWGFTWRFYDVAAIWTERNVFMMNTYWPRRAHIEIESFQPSKLDKNDMRVPLSDDRPELRVRAYEWVIADRKAPRGWRALKWNDLAEHRLIEKDLLDRVAIPADFKEWNLDTEELEPNLVEALFGERKTGRKSGEVRDQLKLPASRKKIEERGAEETLREWLDWQDWTVDKLALQMKDTEVRTPMRASLAERGCSYDDLEMVFTKLDELAESPWYSRTIRKLRVPKTVDVKFRGEEGTTHEPPYPLKEETNKYNVALDPLKGSLHYKFRVRGDNYFSPLKSVTLVAAPTPATISTDTEEPAYIYHRLPFKRERVEFDNPDSSTKDKKDKFFKEFVVDDQMPLQKLRHSVKDVSRPTSGILSTVEVMLGSKLTIHVAIDSSPVVWGDVSLGKVRPSLRERLKLPAGEGLLVTAVTERSPLETAGLQAGDVVVKINGSPAPSNLEKLVEWIQESRSTPAVEFTVLSAKSEYQRATLQAPSMPEVAKYTPRKLRGDKSVIGKDPPVIEQGADGFVGRVKTHPDLLGFSIEMDTITRNHHFMVEFFDEDKIRGTRYFKVTRTLDADPSVGNLSIFGYTPRTPRIKAAAVDKDAPKDKDKDKEKDKDAPEPTKEQLEVTKGFLITPDAKIPLECKVTDDYGLVRVGYHYKFRKIDFELVANLGQKKASSVQIDQTMRRKHGIMVGNNFLNFAAHPLTWLAPPTLALDAEEIQSDLLTAQGYREGFVSSPAFEALLQRKLETGEMTPLNKLVLEGKSKARPWEFDFRDDRGFDLKKHLRELKTIHPELGQLHYHLQLAVQATDNNVETGAPHFVEIYEDDGNGKKIKKTIAQRGNTKKNGNGYLNFVVITENELLAQIALEEELLYEKLQAAKDKVDQGMVSLKEQQIKITGEKPDMDAIVARMNLIRTALGTAGNNLRDTHGAYDNILKEMDFNRVMSKKVKRIEDDIINRLDDIVIDGGSLSRADRAFTETHEQIEKDFSEKRDPDAAEHKLRMVRTYAEMDRLSKEIDRVLGAMTEGMVESQLIAIVAAIESEQRKTSAMLRKIHKDVLDITIKGLTEDPKKKSSDARPAPGAAPTPRGIAPKQIEREMARGAKGAVSWQYSPPVETSPELVISRLVPRTRPVPLPAHAAGPGRTPNFNL